MHKWKRRDFLRHSAMAAIVAPIASYWDDLPEARAIAGRKQMVLVWLPNGDVTGQKVAEVVGQEWRFAKAYTAYQNYRQDMVVFHHYGYDEIGWGHTDAGTAMFSGATSAHPADCAGEGPKRSKTYGKLYASLRTCGLQEVVRAPVGPSIDQIVAWDYLKRGVITDPLRKTLNAYLPADGTGHIFFQTPADFDLDKTYGLSTPMKQVTRQILPHIAFNRLFGGVAGLAGGASASALWALGKSMLDIPSAELGSLRNLVSADGQELVDRHLSGLRDVEVSLAQQAPAAESPLSDLPRNLDPNDFNNHAQLYQLWVKIIDAAFRSDRTRIATIQFGESGARYIIPSLKLAFVGGKDGNNGTDHHSYTHHKYDDVWRFMQWYSDQVAVLLDTLKGTTSGQPDLLHDSVVLVGTESGYQHRSADVPVLLFGQAGGYLKTGQILDFGNDPFKHTGMLLTVCQAMGLEGRFTKLGNPMYQKGPIEAMKA